MMGPRRTVGAVPCGRPPDLPPGGKVAPKGADEGALVCPVLGGHAGPPLQVTTDRNFRRGGPMWPPAVPESTREARLLNKETQQEQILHTSGSGRRKYPFFDLHPRAGWKTQARSRDFRREIFRNRRFLNGALVTLPLLAKSLAAAAAKYPPAL